MCQKSELQGNAWNARKLRETRPIKCDYWGPLALNRKMTATQTNSALRTRDFYDFTNWRETDLRTDTATFRDIAASKKLFDTQFFYIEQEPCYVNHKCQCECPTKCDPVPCGNLNAYCEVIPTHTRRLIWIHLSVQTSDPSTITHKLPTNYPNKPISFFRKTRREDCATEM